MLNKIWVVFQVQIYEIMPTHKRKKAIMKKYSLSIQKVDISTIDISTIDM